MIRLVKYLADEAGLDFPPSRSAELERGLGAIGREYGLGSREECIHWILAHPDGIRALAAYVTTGETYFWREPETFQRLQEVIIPGMIGRRRLGIGQRLRIWSVGCATGEEAYSLAILLRRILGAAVGWHVTILATDISTRSLSIAASGRYGPWSFRGAPQWIHGYFQRAPRGQQEVQPQLREWVHFAYLNLARGPFPALANDTTAMDVVLCRNVLMYLTRTAMRSVLAGLAECLAPGGSLITSATESHLVRDTGLFTPDEGPLPVFRKAPEGVRETALPADIGDLDRLHAPAYGLPDHRTSATTGVESPASPARPRISPADLDIFVPEAEATLDAVDARMQRIRTLANGAKNADALVGVDEALATDELNPQLHYLRGAILRAIGEDEEAISALRKALYISPKYVLAHVTIGTLLRSRESDLAARHLRSALELTEGLEDGEVWESSENLTAGELRSMVRWQLERIRG